ncbi:DNA translocase FtsK [Secundilactobacillus muriivasis]
MNHYDGPAFFRRYQRPKPDRSVTPPVTKQPEVPAISRQREPQQRVKSVAPRPVQPMRTSRPRKQAQSNKPVKHDWHDDQPFRPSSIPRQLSKRRITRDRVDYPRLLATYFTKPDEDVLLPVDARDVALADATVSEPLQYAGDAVVATQSGDDFNQATTMLYPDDTSATRDSDGTQLAVTTLHDKSDDDVESTVAGVSTPVTVSTDESETDVDSAVSSGSQPSGEVLADDEETSVDVQTTRASQPGVAGQSTDEQSVVDVEPLTQPATVEPNASTDDESSEPVKADIQTNEVSQLKATISVQPTDKQSVDDVEPATSVATEETDKLADDEVAEPSSAPNPAVADGVTDEQVTSDDETEAKVSADAAPASVSETTATQIVDSADDEQQPDSELNQDHSSAVAAQPEPVQATDFETVTEAATEDETQATSKDVTEDVTTVPTTNDEVVAPEAKQVATTPVKPAREASHSLGHSLGDIMSEESTGLSDLALFQDKPVVADDVTTAARGYQFPSPDLLTPPVVPDETELDEWIEHQGEVLDETLQAFHVDAHVVDWTIGPTVTQFQVHLALGVKVNKITNLTDDLKLALAAKDIRIEAPIPGKTTVGIEIPNPKTRPVMLSEVLRSDAFKKSKSPLTVALGVDLFGQPQVTDLRKMPHGLIAGATGSGKSVFINSLLISLLYKATPADLRLLLIDPKAVELAPYDGMPHLLAPVISDPKAASAALKWAVNEMDDRYERLAAAGVRNIEQYNERAELTEEYGLKLPYIVIIIDELADLMMMASSEVQDYIVRITQKARAAGIHLLIATQRPSVDIVTGTIKNNIPTRVAFMVSSQVDSRTIIDTSGAERLLGRGDMLYLGNGASQPLRLQGTFVDDEVDRITDFVRTQGKPHYAFDPDGLLEKQQVQESQDELLPEVLDYIVQEKTVSTSKLQRVFSIGYNRAANLIDTLENEQYISGQNGSKPRDVFLTEKQLAEMRAPRTD